MCDWGGGGVLNCSVDLILQEFYTLFLTRFRTYKTASPPQTKMTSKDDINGLVSLKFLRPCCWATPPPTPAPCKLLSHFTIFCTFLSMLHLTGHSTELRCTFLSYAAPTELRCTILSYDAPCCYGLLIFESHCRMEKPRSITIIILQLNFYQTCPALLKIERKLWNIFRY